jgi:hypothetical protein
MAKSCSSKQVGNATMRAGRIKFTVGQVLRAAKAIPAPLHARVTSVANSPNPTCTRLTPSSATVLAPSSRPEVRGEMGERL